MPRATPENIVIHETLLRLGKDPDVLLLKNPVGAVKLKEQWIRYGCGGPGASDFFGFLTTPSGLIAFFAEFKSADGRQREDQKTFEQMVTRRGGRYFLWRSADQAEADVQAMKRESGKWRVAG